MDRKRAAMNRIKHIYKCNWSVSISVGNFEAMNERAGNLEVKISIAHLGIL